MEATGDCADLSRNDLAAEAVRSFGQLRLRVTGTSMLPAIRPGDVLLIRHCSVGEPDPGDVVLFTRDRRLFAHRMVSRTGPCLVTQGDAIGAPDAPVNASELLGKVVRVFRRDKPVRNPSQLTFSDRIAAMLVRRSAGAGRLLMGLHRLQHRTGL